MVYYVDVVKIAQQAGRGERVIPDMASSGVVWSS